MNVDLDVSVDVIGVEQLAAILAEVQRRLGRRLEVKVGAPRFGVSLGQADLTFEALASFRFRKGSRWFQVHLDNGFVCLMRDSHGAPRDKCRFDLADPGSIDGVIAYLKRRIR